MLEVMVGNFCGGNGRGWGCVNLVSEQVIYTQGEDK